MADYKLQSNVWKFCCIGGVSIVGLLAFSTAAVAQNTINPDTTLGNEPSVVISFNAAIDLITGGAVRQQNLFHSFEEFSIGDGYEAYFITESEAIANIFARITGDNLSEIQGVLGTRQSAGTGFVPTNADLFLINPNGVVFGENAVLDVGGSFTATTASGMRFGDAGSFSAVNPEAPSTLLTINPSAYFFNQLPIGEISSRSIQPDLIDGATAGLRVPNGEALTLLGGDINLDGGGIEGGLTALGGRVEIGAVDSPGMVEFNAANALAFPDILERADIVLANNSSINTAADGGGDVSVYAYNFSISDVSGIFTGIGPGLGNQDSRAGNIRVDARGSITVSDTSVIGNIISGFGEGGDIDVTAQDIVLINGSQISTVGLGQGDVGDVTLQASGTISFSGSGILTTAVGFFPGDGDSGDITLQASNIDLSDGAAIASRNLVVSGFEDPGNAGNINIITDNLSVVDGSILSSSTSGTGNAGNIVINASSQVVFDGMNENGRLSTAFSTSESGATGDAGNVQIKANSLAVTNGARLNSSTLGLGNAGDVVLDDQGF